MILINVEIYSIYNYILFIYLIVILGGNVMSVRYVKLWKLLLDRGLKRTDLISLAGISSNVLAKLGKDEYVAMESICKICCALKCDVGDIMEIISDEDGGNA